MPSGLRRFQLTRHSHFVTFSCYRQRLQCALRAVLLIGHDVRLHSVNEA